jgi:ribonuclease HI
VTDADGDDGASPARERPPAESLTPLATSVLDVLVAHAYDLSSAVEAIDAAVPGIGGLFDPTTDRATLTTAVERVLADADAAPQPTPPAAATAPTPDAVVLYVDGSARSNPGPAGAGAVVQTADGETLAELGRPVGSRADNNTAEYAALLLGLEYLARYIRPERVEVRIDSMTVIRDVWEEADGPDGVAKYREPIRTHLAALPAHEWTHLVDSDPNPADALATVGADIAELGPGA